MKTICWLEDVFRTDLPNIEKLQERDLYGRNAETLCFNNPDYRNFLTGSGRRLRAFLRHRRNHVGIRDGKARFPIAWAPHMTMPPIDPGKVTCFCQFCQAKAKERGINVERARARIS